MADFHNDALQTLYSSINERAIPCAAAFPRLRRAEDR